MLGAAAFATGGVLIAPAIVLKADSIDGRIVVAVICAAVFALYVVVLFRAFIVAPILLPLRDLTEASQRVKLGDLSRWVSVTSTDEFGELVLSFNEMQDGLRQRESLRAAFGSYVDPALAERVLAQDSSLFEGQEVEVTVFFLDVRDFTSFAEEVEARDAFALLNRLFGIVVPEITSVRGHVNRFLGDGVLAVFGVPELLVDHADRALAAAVQIQRRVAAEFNNQLHIGIGLNSGTVIAGTLGGGGKLDFTVIGDAVNIAARVEQLTKETGDPILLTGATLESLAARPPTLLTRGEYPLKGKSVALPIYAVPPAPPVSILA